MAHEIATINGRPAMMFVGELPWHGLGKSFETPPHTAEEVIKAAELDWEVDLKPVYVLDDGQFHDFPEHRAAVRVDQQGRMCCPPFGLVGKDYRVMQNRDAFEFFDPLVAAGGITYETAGALGQGERVWILARVGGDMRIKGKDEVRRYLLLSNGHDGRTPLQIRFTPVRVVCANTLSSALSSGQDLLRLHHGRDLDRRVGVAQEQVKRILERYAQLSEHFERFARKAMTKDNLLAFSRAVFPEPRRRQNQTERSYERAVAMTNRLRGRGTELFEEGAGNKVEGIRGTVWTAYNGITELVDHHLEYASRSQRLAFLWFGEGERIKARAFNLAVEFSKN